MQAHLAWWAMHTPAVPAPPASFASRACPPALRHAGFDLDGVLTRTAELHAAVWKQTFDAFPHQWAARSGHAQALFDAARDYVAYVGGKPRARGVSDLLAARGIALPAGVADDPPSADTVAGLGRRKVEMVARMMDERAVGVCEGSRRFLVAVRDAGLATALVSSSENATAVLRAAGLAAGLFDAHVDGIVAGRLGLRGKPEPDLFLEAGRRLGVAQRRAAVFEDALAGVQAGRAGGSGLVVGVDRVAGAAQLRPHGADVVVADLAELLRP